MLTLRQRLGFIIAGIVLVLGGIVFWYWWTRREPVVKEPVNQAQEATTTVPVAPPALSNEVPRFGDTPITAPTNVNAEELYIRQLAGIFVERFATFSNQNNNRNLADVEPISTPSLMDWVMWQSLAASSTYQGVTARVLSTTLVKREGDAATVNVSAQETLSRVGAADELRQRTGRVELIKLNGVWKVNAFYWDK